MIHLNFRIPNCIDRWRTKTILIVLLVLATGKPLYGNESIIRQLAENEEYGLVLFYTPNCNACLNQLSVFITFIHQTGWKPCKVINIEENPDAAIRFGVETVPEIWFVKQNGRTALIAKGFIPYDIMSYQIITAYNIWYGKIN